MLKYHYSWEEDKGKYPLKNWNEFVSLCHMVMKAVVKKMQNHWYRKWAIEMFYPGVPRWLCWLSVRLLLLGLWAQAQDSAPCWARNLLTIKLICWSMISSPNTSLFVDFSLFCAKLRWLLRHYLYILLLFLVAIVHLLLLFPIHLWKAKEEIIF